MLLAFRHISTTWFYKVLKLFNEVYLSVRDKFIYLYSNTRKGKADNSKETLLFIWQL